MHAVLQLLNTCVEQACHGWQVLQLWPETRPLPPALQCTLWGGWQTAATCSWTHAWRATGSRRLLWQAAVRGGPSGQNTWSEGTKLVGLAPGAAFSMAWPAACWEQVPACRKHAKPGQLTCWGMLSVPRDWAGRAHSRHHRHNCGKDGVICVAAASCLQAAMCRAVIPAAAGHT